jgi:hypothetical protein
MPNGNTFDGMLFAGLSHQKCLRELSKGRRREKAFIGSLFRQIARQGKRFDKFNDKTPRNRPFSYRPGTHRSTKHARD